MIFVSYLLFLSFIPLAMLFIILIIVKFPAMFRHYLLFYAGVIALIVYCYSPTYENDLARYYMQIDFCKNLSFSQAFFWGNDGLLVKNLLFWLLAQINQKNLLQAIATGTLYGVSAYICYDSLPKKQNFWKILLLLFAFLPLHTIVNNVRNMLGFALVSLAFYRDLVQKKRNLSTVALYIIPCLIHMTGVIMIPVRLLLPFLKKYLRVSIPLIALIPFFTTNFYFIASKIHIPGFVGLIVNRAIQKAYSTVLSTSKYALRMQESGYVRACMVVMFLFCGITACLSLRYLILFDTHDRYRNFIIVDMFFCVFTCVYILCGAVKFWVFAVISVICAAPLMEKFFFENTRFFPFDQIFRLIIPALALCRFALEIYFMSARINLTEILGNMFLTNPYTILFHIISYLVS